MKSLSEFIDQQNREFEESMAAAAASSVTHNNGLGEEPLTLGLMTIEEETKKAGLVEELAKQIANEKDVMQHTKDKIFLYELRSLSLSVLVESMRSGTLSASTLNQRKKRFRFLTMSRLRIRRPTGLLNVVQD